MQFTYQDFQDFVGRELTYHEAGHRLVLATTLGDPDLKGKPYELFQTFDQNDEVILIEDKAVVLYRKECHGQDRIKHVFHRGGNCFIVNSKDQVLIPKRAPDKDLFPSMGDVSVSEHVKILESYHASVMRGFLEEQGAEADQQRLFFFLKVPVFDSEQSEMCSYYVYFSGEDEEFNFSEEITSQAWIPISSLKEEKGLKKVNFRPDHLPALLEFIKKYDQLKENFKLIY